MNQQAQGDVLFTQVSALPNDLKVVRIKGAIIFAHGEVTGHKHQAFVTKKDAQLLVADQRTAEEELLDVRFLRVMASSGIDIVHEEHGTIHLAPGDYKISLQREWTDADEPIRVQD